METYMGPSGAFGGDMFFGGFNTIFFLVFFIILGVILFTFIKGIQQWSYNNQQPVLTVAAIVVTKRANVSRNVHHHGDHHHHSSSTTYYVTFQVESGDRMELHVNGREYGQMAEGDKGKLTFQGTRYLKFERIV